MTKSWRIIGYEWLRNFIATKSCISGREPRLAAMDVQAAGVTVDQRTGKIVTDARERTSNKRIFAIGDVAAVCVVDRTVERVQNAPWMGIFSKEAEITGRVFSGWTRHDI